MCEFISYLSYALLMSSQIFFLFSFWLPRRPQTGPGDHHRGGKTARLPPHSVERAVIRPHYPVHPEMENRESLLWVSALRSESLLIDEVNFI